MSDLKFLHKVKNQFLKNGVVETYEEEIIDGAKGIRIHFFKKDAKGVERINIYGKDGEFVMDVMKDDKNDKKTITLAELKAELSKNKNLKFAADFAKSVKGGRLMNKTLGGRKSSKRTSVKRKSSKRVSRKSSKRNSKRNSKK